MRRGDAQPGSREVDPVQSGRKRKPSDLARKARRAEARAAEARTLMNAIEAKTKARHEAWAEGGHPNVTHVATEQLTRLHGDKREMRREIYRAAPELEGAPVFKRHPGRAA